MKAKQVNLESNEQLSQIRPGQMFQVQSKAFGSFKSPSYRSTVGWLYFVRQSDNTPVPVEMVDVLLYLDPLA